VTIRNFRYLAVAEAISFLLLIVASVIKNTGGTEIGVQILGPLHGLLFIGYIALAFALMRPAGWTPFQTFWIMVGAILPFGGFVVDWWLARHPAPATS
jgi:integral membrane protein